MPDISDDEIIVREKRKIRLAVLWGLVGGLIFVGIAVLIWAVQPVWLDKYLPLLPGIAIIAALVTSRLFWWPAPEAMSDRILRKRVDEFQGRNRVFMLVGALVVGNVLLHAPANIKQLTPGIFPPQPVTIIFLLMTLASLIAFGFGWLNRRLEILRNEELARALRFRVSRLGYLLLMAGLCAAYLTLLYRPDLLSQVLRGVLFAGIAIPTCAYIILEWRAGRSA